MKGFLTGVNERVRKCILALAGVGSRIAWADYDASGTPIARYSFGDRTDEILARWRPGEGTAWYLADHIGTIRDLVNAAAAEAVSLENEVMHLLGGPRSINPATQLRNQIQALGEGNADFIPLEFAADDGMVIEALRRAGLLGS